MKTIYIDVSMLMIGTRFTGIPRVVMEVCARLYEKEDLDLVFLEYDARKDAYHRIDSEGFIRFCKTGDDVRFRLRTREYLHFDEFEKDAVFFDMDTVWKTPVRRSFLYPRIKRQGVRIVCFLQDVIGITHPQFCPTDDMLQFADFIDATLTYADLVIATSNATKEEIIKLQKECGKPAVPVVIAPLGSNFGNTKVCGGQQENEKSTAEKKGLTEKVHAHVKEAVAAGNYLLMVGTLDPRKNHKLLLDAYDGTGKEDPDTLKAIGMHLVIAGYPGWNNDAFTERLKKHKDLYRGIWYFDDASDADIEYLYQNGFALAFPSYIEGYGLPIVESMTKGLPVIAMDTPINREIGGEYAEYFPADAPKKLVEIAHNYVEDADAYRKWKESLKSYRPLTWDETAEALYGYLS